MANLFAKFPTIMAHGIREGLTQAAGYVQTRARQLCPKSPTQAMIDDAIMQRVEAKEEKKKERKPDKKRGRKK